MTYRSFLGFMSKVVGLILVFLTMAWVMTGPFVAFLNAASTFAVLGAFIMATIAILGGGFLAWKLVGAILNQAQKEMI